MKPVIRFSFIYHTYLKDADDVDRGANLSYKLTPGRVLEDINELGAENTLLFILPVSVTI